MNELPKGLIFKKRHEKAPDFVRGGISIKKDEFIDYLRETDDDWVNFQLLNSKDGNLYFKLDTWKPNQEKPEGNKEDITDDLPF